MINQIRVFVLSFRLMIDWNDQKVSINTTYLCCIRQKHRRYKYFNLLVEISANFPDVKAAKKLSEDSFSVDFFSEVDKVHISIKC